MISRVLVTGATGFVGTALCGRLAAEGYRVRAALRSDRPVSASIHEKAVVGDIGTGTDWSSALDGVDYVIHLAARVHVMHDSPQNADLYAETNTQGTRSLAQQSVLAGVRRLVFLSTIKVNGEESERPYSASDTPRPADAYGRSKLMAEQELASLCANGRMEFAVVRPPLVYGPGVRANFLRMLRWVESRKPLPFGAIRNRRSLVNVWNLSDLLTNVLANTAARNAIWMVSDGEDLSTAALIRRTAAAFRLEARLLPVPVSMLRLAGVLTGKSAEVSRLCGSLCVAVDSTCASLGWTPPVHVDEALARTVKWYVSTGAARGR